MTESSQQTSAPPPQQSWLEPGILNLQILYALYLASFAVGVSAIIAVVIAYINRAKAPDYLQTHYIWLIRTFWIGALFLVLSALLSMVLVGILTGIATAVWFIIRCVIGLQRASRGEAIEHPKAWLF